MGRWRDLGRQVVLERPYFQVCRHQRQSPGGAQGEFLTISCPDWANVVAITPDDHMVLVRQYRHGTQDYTLELPGGVVDPGETPAQAAARELMEETGHQAPELVSLGSVNPNPAMFGNRCHTYLARGAVAVAAPRPEELEDLQVHLVPTRDLPALVRAGRIDHALIVAALGLFWLRER